MFTGRVKIQKIVSTLFLKEKNYICAKCNNYSHGVVNLFKLLHYRINFRKLSTEANIHIDFLLVKSMQTCSLLSKTSIQKPRVFNLFHRWQKPIRNGVVTNI